MFGQEPKTILLVEDEAIIARGEAQTIKESGYEVITAHSGEKAVELAIDHETIDLVLMDIDLGKGMDGTEAARQILSRRNIPIVFLTSHAEQETVEKVKNITRYGLVTKNSGDFVLLASIEMAFELFAANHKARRNEELYRSLFENMINGFAYCKMHFEQDRPVDFTYLLVNKAFTTQTGLPDVVGKKVTEVIPGIRELDPDLLARYGRVALSGTPESFETYVASLKMWFSISVYSPQKEYFVAVFDMISERKKTEEALRAKSQLNQTLLDAFPCVALLLRPQTREIIAANAAAIKAGALPGTHCFSAWAQRQDPCPWCLAPALWATGEAQHLEVEAEGIFWDAHWIPVADDLYMHFAFEITERKQREEEYKTILRTAMDGYWLLDTQGRFLDANDSYCLLVGYRHDELMKMRITDIEAVETAEETRRRIQKVIAVGSDRFESRHRRKDGEIVDVEVSVNYLPIHNGRFFVFVRDIGERKRAEEARRRSEDEARRMAAENAIIAEIGRVVNSDLNIETIFHHFSESVHKIIPFDLLTINQINREDRTVLERYSIGLPVPGRRSGDIFPLAGTVTDEIAQTRRGLIAQFREESEVAAQFPGLLPGFRSGIRSFLSVPLIHQDEVVGGLHFRSKEAKVYSEKDLRLAESVGNQISGAIANAALFLQVKAEEEKVLHALHEKELLLKEVHHRIKNNMNTIISLLALQSRTLQDPSAVAALKDAQSRVRSMMVLYDKLYRSTGFNKISAMVYLAPLIDEIIGNFPNRGMVKIEKNLEDFILDARILSPLGILINELLTNAMKSAFTGRENGVISVSASIRENHVAVVIQDNGIGIPESIDLKDSPGFGLQIVGMLTEQMDGRIRIERQNGTKFILEFRAIKYSELSCGESRKFGYREGIPGTEQTGCGDGS